MGIIENQFEERDEQIQFSLSLPEGMGVKIRTGQRFMLNSHYINYYAEPILARDYIQVELAPPESIETWAAPWWHFHDGFELPPNEESEVRMECRWKEDYTLLMAAGHMHEWGTAFSIDHVRPGASTERIYDIPEWDPDFRDDPPLTEWAPETYQVKAGDSFVTKCHYFNNRDYPLLYPEEMCLSVGMLYPAESEVGCWRR